MLPLNVDKPVSKKIQTNLPSDSCYIDIVDPTMYQNNMKVSMQNFSTLNSSLSDIKSKIDYSHSRIDIFNKHFNNLESKLENLNSKITEIDTRENKHYTDETKAISDSASSLNGTFFEEMRSFRRKLNELTARNDNSIEGFDKTIKANTEKIQNMQKFMDMLRNNLGGVYDYICKSFKDNKNKFNRIFTLFASLKHTEPESLQFLQPPVINFDV
jgi:chromosome segregation ATPase